MLHRLHDHTLHCSAAGPEDGPVLVLLHSLGTSALVWQEQVAALSGTHRILCPDFRGHGLSAVSHEPLRIDRLAGDVLALLDTLEIGRFALAGISLGGVVAQAVAAAAGERLTGLAIFDSYVVAANPAMWHDRAATVRRDGLATIAEGVLGLWMGPEERATPAGEGLARMLALTPDEGYAAACDALAGADLRARVGAIRAPCIIACGAADRAAPITASQTLAQLVPGADLRVIPGAAHIPLLHHAGECTSILKTIL